VLYSCSIYRARISTAQCAANHSAAVKQAGRGKTKYRSPVLGPAMKACWTCDGVEKRFQLGLEPPPSEPPQVKPPPQSRHLRIKSYSKLGQAGLHREGLDQIELGPRQCEGCSTVFERTRARPTKRFCSRRCRDRWRKKP
jgi:hypothetical protein